MSVDVRVAILGAGGDALVVAETIRQCARAGQSLSLAGFLDDNLVGQSIDGLPVFGRLEDWSMLDASLCFIPAIHKIKQMHARMRRLRELDMPPNRWCSVIHPT